MAVAAKTPPAVNIEIINTGSELLLGRVLNTHQQWLCRHLADLGCVVARQVTVNDTGLDIQQAVREALTRADVILVTGGLGPTTDDLTREKIAELLGKPLHEDARVMAHISGYFAKVKRPMSPNNRLQALVPEGARVLWNPNGTAPGLAMEVRPNPFRADAGSAWIFMLPGPPRELHPMFIQEVLPLLRDLLPSASAVVSRTLRSTGVGESRVQHIIAQPLQSLVDAGLEIGYCAHTGQVDVRLLSRGPDAQRRVDEAEQIVRAQMGEQIFGTEDEDLETVLVRLLAERKQTLVLAESCTGGGIAHRITNVPGASAVFLAGFVTYSNEAKGRFLGVSAETLALHGAVSEPVARQMAEGARRVSGADFAIAVTGIAGPGGGSEAKPVGTVFMAVSGAEGTRVEHLVYAYDRIAFKQATGSRALDLLRRVLLGHVSLSERIPV